jgi:fructokinase
VVRIGVDLGGTKIEIIVIDENGEERFRRRVATPRGDYVGTVETIASLVHGAERELGLSHTPVGVGAPGTLSSETGFIKNSNSTWIIGKPLDKDLASALKRPVKLANDANCFALSESVDGAATGASVVFGIILGTGVGGGIVVHGRVLNGANGIAGEWGHNPLPWPKSEELPGPQCYCGRHGCIEAFLSGPALAREFQQKGSGLSLKSEEIVVLAEKKDAVADAFMAVFEERLARALAHVINVLDPDVIVAGGGLSNISRIYETVPRLWGKFVFSDSVRTRLVKARFGDSSGVRGAAWLN